MDVHMDISIPLINMYVIVICDNTFDIVNHIHKTHILITLQLYNTNINERLSLNLQISHILGW